MLGTYNAFLEVLFVNNVFKPAISNEFPRGYILHLPLSLSTLNGFSLFCLVLGFALSFLFLCFWLSPFHNKVLALLVSFSSASHVPPIGVLITFVFRKNSPILKVPKKKTKEKLLL